MYDADGHFRFQYGLNVSTASIGINILEVPTTLHTPV